MGAMTSRMSALQDHNVFASRYTVVERKQTTGGTNFALTPPPRESNTTAKSLLDRGRKSDNGFEMGHHVPRRLFI